MKIFVYLFNVYLKMFKLLCVGLVIVVKLIFVIELLNRYVNEFVILFVILMVFLGIKLVNDILINNCGLKINVFNVNNEMLIIMIFVVFV